MRNFIVKALKGIGLVLLLIVMASILVFYNAPSKEDMKIRAGKEKDEKELSALMVRCENYVRGVVINKSTLDFPFSGLSKWKGDDGNLYATREFNAKNKFGLEQKYKASCIESEGGKTQYRIDELIGN